MKCPRNKCTQILVSYSMNVHHRMNTWKHPGCALEQCHKKQPSFHFPVHQKIYLSPQWLFLLDMGNCHSCFLSPAYQSCLDIFSIGWMYFETVIFFKETHTHTLLWLPRGPTSFFVCLLCFLSHILPSWNSLPTSCQLCDLPSHFNSFDI